MDRNDRPPITIAAPKVATQSGLTFYITPPPEFTQDESVRFAGALEVISKWYWEGCPHEIDLGEFRMVERDPDES